MFGKVIRLQLYITELKVNCLLPFYSKTNGKLVKLKPSNETVFGN